MGTYALEKGEEAHRSSVPLSSREVRYLYPHTHEHELERGLSQLDFLRLFTSARSAFSPTILLCSYFCFAFASLVKSQTQSRKRERAPEKESAEAREIHEKCNRQISKTFAPFKVLTLQTIIPPPLQCKPFIFHICDSLSSNPLP